MISGKVSYLGSFGDEAGYVFNYLHVAFRPITFAELPDVDNVTIQNQPFGFDWF